MSFFLLLMRWSDSCCVVGGGGGNFPRKKRSHIKMCAFNEPSHSLPRIKEYCLTCAMRLCQPARGTSHHRTPVDTLIRPPPSYNTHSHVTINRRSRSPPFPFSTLELTIFSRAVAEAVAGFHPPRQRVLFKLGNHSTASYAARATPA